MLDIPSITGIVAAAGVIIGAILAILELRTIARTRQMELVMGLYSTFITKEFQDAYDILWTTDFKDYNEVLRKGQLIRLRTVGGFFEGIGVLLYRKLVEVRLIDDLFRESIKLMWEKARAPLCDARQQLNLPGYARYFEYLYNETQKQAQSP
ncbi:MAG: hypothetical protein JSV58_05655 [Candidatus Bathyarchaeota archaeon]|nr:MAG: hypothetical protein JSV58_05655 [Candidatus Bathyarchaeota archaeon]